MLPVKKERDGCRRYYTTPDEATKESKERDERVEAGRAKSGFLFSLSSVLALEEYLPTVLLPSVQSYVPR